ncbi:MAG: 6-carboxytetrahydropterin synthase [Myxococcota bacterium]|nr:6-carboxytetrahydropterin synthase [Myxococcota bacterium]
MKRFGIRVDKQYFNFACAHFLLFPDGTREELHGHNYQVAVEVDGELMDGDVVLDFIPFKPIVKRCCDSLDHRTIFPTKSPWLSVEEVDGSYEIRHGADRFLLPKQDVRLLPITNTSSERLAEYLAGEIIRHTQDAIPSARIDFIRVSVQESPGQSAIFQHKVES